MTPVEKLVKILLIFSILIIIAIVIFLGIKVYTMWKLKEEKKKFNHKYPLTYDEAFRKDEPVAKYIIGVDPVSESPKTLVAEVKKAEPIVIEKEDNTKKALELLVKYLKQDT